VMGPPVKPTPVLTEFTAISHASSFESFTLQ
jgi:hypothetical protein